MKRSGIVNLRNFRFLEQLAKNRLLIILCLLFFAGVIAGSVSRGENSNLASFAENGIRQLTSDRSEKSLGVIFLDSFADSMLYMLAVFAAGTSMLGIVIAPLTVAWRGFYYGLLTSYLYGEFALRGIAFNAIVLIPPALFSLIGIVLGAKESVSFSLVIAKLTLPRSAPKSLFSDFRIYCTKFSLFIIAILLSALTDICVSHFFIGFFNFQ